MKLSVIIPCFNRKNELDACLRGVVQSDFKNFELIVVDDASSDGTAEFAASFARVISNRKKLGAQESRKVGAREASGDILVFIDSDIVLEPGSLRLISDYFARNAEAAAVTGRLSSGQQPGFFTDYKNLYMNFNFGKLPEEVTFLYGSIFALRRNALEFMLRLEAGFTEDTELGQMLHRAGLGVRYLNDLQVEHLKKYSFSSLLLNDFRVPFSWGHLFMARRGWKTLGAGGGGFAHAGRRQLLAISALGASCALILVWLCLWLAKGYQAFPLLPVLAVTLTIWFLANSDFFHYMVRERGWAYGVLAGAFTALDQLVMGTGAFFGMLTAYFTGNFKKAIGPVE